MDFVTSSLWRDVQRIIRSPAKPVNFVYMAQVHTDEGNYLALKVVALDIVENFKDSYGPEIQLEVLFPLGTYAKRILPKKDNLQVTLTRIPVDEIGVSINTSQDILSMRYQATLMTVTDAIMEDGAGFEANETTLNTSDFDSILFQLTDPAMEQLRMAQYGTNFRYTTVENAVKTALDQAMKSIKVDGAEMKLGVDMVPAENTKPRNAIVIPQDTAVIDIADYIQKKCGGVYSEGLSQYIKGKYWYIFPTYDINRYSSTLKTMNVILVPQNKLPGIERTYLLEGDCLTVLCTADRKFTDKSQSLQLNRGNGIQFADAAKVMNGFVTTKDNKTVASRGANNSEYIRTPRENGLNNVKVSDRPFSVNTYEENAKLAARTGSYFQFLWEKSNTDVITPGMMIRITYLADEIVTMEGVIVAAHHYVQLAGQGMSSGRYYSNTGIVAYINKKF